MMNLGSKSLTAPNSKNSLRFFFIAASLYFSLISTLFSFEVALNPRNPVGGEGVRINIRGAGHLGYEIIFGGKSFSPFRTQAGVLEIFLPVPIEAKGASEILIREKFVGITIGEKKEVIEVTPRDFKVIKLKPASEKMRDKQPAVPEQKLLVSSAIKRLSGEKFWSESFSAPLEGKIGEPFAVKRVGARYSYFHKGVDYPAPIGEPVKAINDGEIILSERGLNIYGNMLVIDHGHGIISCYWHLNELYKNKNDKVKKGEVIAEVGNTGWSTGPHLHFGVYLQGEAVDPLWFIDFTGNISQ